MANQDLIDAVNAEITENTNKITEYTNIIASLDDIIVQTETNITNYNTQKTYNEDLILTLEDRNIKLTDVIALIPTT